jgi:hypothetical protein
MFVFVWTTIIIITILIIKAILNRVFYMNGLCTNITPKSCSWIINKYLLHYMLSMKKMKTPRVNIIQKLKLINNNDKYCLFCILYILNYIEDLWLPKTWHVNNT